MSTSQDGPELALDGNIVLILVGLIGSGKSTFAEALERHVPQFHRCCQDELGGDRRRVEDMARRTLREGFSVCIDRTNLDATQRSHWINIAREFPGTAVWLIVFDTPYRICAERLQHRQGHPTIKDAGTALRLLSRFAASFDAPAPLEGHERLITVTPGQHPSAEYTRTDVLAILQRLKDAPPIDAHAPSAQRPMTQSLRGGRGGGYRARGTARYAYAPYRGGTSQGSWRERGGDSGDANAYRRGSFSARGSPGQRGSYDARGWGRAGRTPSHHADRRGDDSNALDRPYVRGAGSAQDPLVLD